MITDKDVSKLKKEFSKDFATKSFVKKELEAMEKRQDAKFANKDDLKEYARQKDIEIIKKELKKMNKSLTVTIKYFDRVTTNHESRIKTVEKTLNIIPPSN